jgi:hypothetical protein
VHVRFSDRLYDWGKGPARVGLLGIGKGYPCLRLFWGDVLRLKMVFSSRWLYGTVSRVFHVITSVSSSTHEPTCDGHSVKLKWVPLGSASSTSSDGICTLPDHHNAAMIPSLACLKTIGVKPDQDHWRQAEDPSVGKTAMGVFVI